MNQYEVSELSSSPSSVDRSRRVKKILLFLLLILFTFALAVIWAVYDVGWYTGPWGKLAFVALTWFALAIALYKLIFKGRVER
jgi:magnesium-transporting ATPase (P-type)